MTDSRIVSAVILVLGVAIVTWSARLCGSQSRRYLCAMRDSTVASYTTFWPGCGELAMSRSMAPGTPSNRSLRRTVGRCISVVGRSVTVVSAVQGWGEPIHPITASHANKRMCGLRVMLRLHLVGGAHHLVGG